MARTKAEGGISGLQKAAILLISLGPERSAGIFKHLKEEEIEELTLEIANTRSVTPQVKEEVINEVLSRMERIRAKTRFARTQAKRERRTKIALKSRSDNTTINKRARRLAINLMKQR